MILFRDSGQHGSMSALFPLPLGLQINYWHPVCSSDILSPAQSQLRLSVQQAPFSTAPLPASLIRHQLLTAITNSGLSCET